MKKLKLIMMCSILLVLITGCGNKYKGYWCNYDEAGTIIVELKTNNSKSDRNTIEKVINNFNDLASFDFLPKDSFTDTDNGEAFDTYLIYFNDTSILDEHVITLKKLKGVKDVEKNYIKNNVKLYEFVDNKNYKYQDGLGVEDNLKVKGKYKIGEEVIKLESPANKSELIIKDKYLCADKDCNTIFTKTDKNCDKIHKK